MDIWLALKTIFAVVGKWLNIKEMLAHKQAGANEAKLKGKEDVEELTDIANDARKSDGVSPDLDPNNIDNKE